MQTKELKSRVIGVDISNERTTYAIVDIRGNIIASDHFPTWDFTDLNRFASKLADAIVTLAESNGGYETSVLSVSVAPVPAVRRAVLRMRPTCPGRVWYLWPLSCATVSVRP